MSKILVTTNVLIRQTVVYTIFHIVLSLMHTIFQLDISNMLVSVYITIYRSFAQKDFFASLTLLGIIDFKQTSRVC